MTGDTIVVPRIDRLARNLTEGLKTIEELHDKGINIRSLAERLDTDDDSPTSRLMLHMLLSLAEWVGPFRQPTSVFWRGEGVYGLMHPHQPLLGLVPQARPGPGSDGTIALLLSYCSSPRSSIFMLTAPGAGAIFSSASIGGKSAFTSIRRSLLGPSGVCRRRVHM